MRKTRFIIPKNFAENGKIYMFNIKNVIEAGLLVAADITFFYVMPFSVKAKLYGIIITSMLLGSLGLMGINGMSLSEFIIAYIQHKKNAKVYTAPTSKDKITREKMLIEKKRKKQKLQEKENKKKKHTFTKPNKHYSKEKGATDE